jgi:hypothetical protein
MFNYSKLSYQLKREINIFSTKISKGLSRPNSKHFGKSGIRTMDRGYDANIYYKCLLCNNEPFIIRAKKNRDVIYKGETCNILDVVKW